MFKIFSLWRDFFYDVSAKYEILTTKFDIRPYEIIMELNYILSKYCNFIAKIAK